MLNFLIILQLVVCVELVLSLGENEIQVPEVICPDLFCPTFGCNPKLYRNQTCPCKTTFCDCSEGFVRRSLKGIGVCLIDEMKPCYRDGREAYHYFLPKLSSNYNSDIFLNCLRLSELQSASSEFDTKWKNKTADFEGKDIRFFQAWALYSKGFKQLNNSYCASGTCTNKICVSSDPPQNLSEFTSFVPNPGECPKIKIKNITQECVTTEQYELIKSVYSKDEQITLADEQVKIFCKSECCQENICKGKADCDENKSTHNLPLKISLSLVFGLVISFL